MCTSVSPSTTTTTTMTTNNNKNNKNNNSDNGKRSDIDIIITFYRDSKRSCASTWSANGPTHTVVQTDRRNCVAEETEEGDKRTVGQKGGALQ